MKKEQIKNLLLSWRSGTTPIAEALVARLFESADEVLMEYADKAENNAVQTKFFEGQRELWLKKNQVISLFHENLSGNIFNFMRPAQRADAPGAEVLSLVSMDTFERSLALETISDQAIKTCQELYHGLSQRLGVVTGGPAIQYRELPAGPHQLAGAFESAVQILNVERQVLLALYALFEHEVINESPPWHEELNEALREGGILPNLKYEVKVEPSPAKADEIQPKSHAKLFKQPPGHVRNHPPTTTARGHRGQFGSDGLGSSPPEYGGHGRNCGVETALPKYSDYGDLGGSRANQTAEIRSTESEAAGLSGEGDKGLGDQLLGRIRELLAASRLRQTAGHGSALRPNPVNPASASEVAAVIGSPQVQAAVGLPETGVLEAGVRRVVVTKALLEKLRAALAAQRAKIKEAIGDTKLSHFDEDTIDIVGMLFEVMLNDKRLTNTVKALLSHLHTPYLKLAVRDRAFLKRREHPARRLFDKMIEAGSRWVNERDLTLGVYAELQRVVDSILKAKDLSTQLLHELDEGLSVDVVLRTERQQSREARTLETELGKARLEGAREKAGQAARDFLPAAGAPEQYQAFMTGPWTDYLTLLNLRSNGDIDTIHWRSAMALSKRLRTFVTGLTAGAIPTDVDLNALRDDFRHRLGAAIPHYETKVAPLFELFSADNEVTIVDPMPAVPPPAPTTTVKLASTGEALLARLPQLPPGSWVVFHNEKAADQAVKLSWFNPKTERFLFVDQAGLTALVVPLRKLADHIDKERAHILLAEGESYVELSLERALGTLEKSS